MRSAQSLGGSTPDVRVTWSTTIPPECVAVVMVEFRTSSHGPVVATNTTTNTSQTVVIQTGLHCGTSYYTTVVVTGGTSDGLHPTLSSRQVQVLVGGKEIVCMRFDNSILILPLYRYTNPIEVRAEVTADSTSIRVSWKWSCQGVLDLVRVDWERLSDDVHSGQYNSNQCHLANLQCNTKYIIWVYARDGQINRTSAPRMVSLLARGMHMDTVVVSYVHLSYI